MTDGRKQNGEDVEARDSVDDARRADDEKRLVKHHERVVPVVEGVWIILVPDLEDETKQALIREMEGVADAGRLEDAHWDEQALGIIRPELAQIERPRKDAILLQREQRPAPVGSAQV